MRKKPEEIKRGMECYDCKSCPYNDRNNNDGYYHCREVEGDALAYIQQLEARVPRWIPVEERLPDCRVLAINDRGVVAVGKIGQFYDRGENVYVCDEWDSNIGIIHVTHWMPLPEPPEEVR